MADQTSRKFGGLGNWLQIGLGLILGLTFAMLVVQNVSLSDVHKLVANATVLPLVVATIAFVADFLLRAVRFWAMLRLATDRQLPLIPMIGPFIASFGMSDVLPLRVGDGFRVVWFSRYFDIPAGTVIGAMVVERILDLATIVILGIFALSLLDQTAPSALVWNFQLILGIAALASLGLLFAPSLMARIFEMLFGRFDFKWIKLLISTLRSTALTVKQIGSWKRLLWLAVMSLALWLLESIVLIGAWISLGEAADELMKPLTAFVFSTLGTLVPSLPGHFGSFEYFGIKAFALTGVNASTAVVVVFLAHLILWAPTAIFGICWLLLRTPHKLRNTS
jgi:uncharacterized protein (TIRG00374 family)